VTAAGGGGVTGGRAAVATQACLAIRNFGDLPFCLVRHVCYRHRRYRACLPRNVATHARCNYSYASSFCVYPVSPIFFEQRYPSAGGGAGMLVRFLPHAAALRGAGNSDIAYRAACDAGGGSAA